MAVLIPTGYSFTILDIVENDPTQGVFFLEGKAVFILAIFYGRGFRQITEPLVTGLKALPHLLLDMEGFALSILPPSPDPGPEDPVTKDVPEAASVERSLSGFWRNFQALLGAIVFYTVVPLPSHWPINFQRIARYAPLVGLALGGLLASADGLLGWLGMPIATRSILVVSLWLALTGGLHLDGAMDTADGLAVPDAEQRLSVMADSRTGAFGVMVAIVILGLKILSLADLPQGRWLVLMAVTGWGRWGQVLAIGRYPYLKPAGKGRFHKEHSRPILDLIPGGVCLTTLLGGYGVACSQAWPLVLGLWGGGIAVAFAVGAWFQRQLGGHTGDTYGAVVEWTEALLLCWAVLLMGWTGGDIL